GNELSRAHRLVSRHRGRREEANVDRSRLDAPERPDAARLDHLRELSLQVGRQVLDVIEKRGSALDVLEEAGSLDLRSGERARSMTEELGLEELRRNRRAVDRLEERIGARTERVNTARDELLPSAGLARDQDGELGISHAKEHRDETAHRRGA